MGIGSPQEQLLGAESQGTAAAAASRLYVQHTEIISTEYDKECPLDPRYLKQMQAFPSLSISVTDTQNHPSIPCGCLYLCSACRKRCVLFSLLHSTKTSRNLFLKLCQHHLGCWCANKEVNINNHKKIVLISSSIRNAGFGSKKNQCQSTGKKNKPPALIGTKGCF